MRTYVIWDDPSQLALTSDIPLGLVERPSFLFRGEMLRMTSNDRVKRVHRVGYEHSTQPLTFNRHHLSTFPARGVGVPLEPWFMSILSSCFIYWPMGIDCAVASRQQNGGVLQRFGKDTFCFGVSTSKSKSQSQNEREKGIRITLLILGADPPARGRKVGDVVDEHSSRHKIGCRPLWTIFCSCKEFACSKNLAVSRKSLTGRLIDAINAMYQKMSPYSLDQGGGNRNDRSTPLSLSPFSPPPSFVRRRFGR